jgi:nucleoside-diphosphate-sugar epimerase
MKIDGKTILITGGAGYVGTTFTKTVLNNYPNSKVIVLDNFSKGRIENIGYIPERNGNLIIEKVDIRDYDKINNLVDKYKPEIVINLAAIVDAFSTNRKGKDIETIEVNATAAIKLAEICKKHKAKIFIQQSSVSIYSRGKDIREGANKEPLSAYGRAKLEAEKGILALDDSKFMVCVLRPATIVGYNIGFRYETIVNLICMCVVYNLPIKNIFESALDGEKTYLHVKDNVDAILFSVENIDTMHGKSYNLTSFNANLRSLFELISEHLGREIKFELVREKNINQQVYTISSKTIQELGFEATKNLEDTIVETVKGLSEFKKKTSDL